MSVVFGGLTARAAAVMVMAADSSELCMNVCRLCAWLVLVLVACCAVCTTVPHHCDDVFVCRVWVHVSPPPPPPAAAALQPDICSGSSPALCSPLSVTQYNECGEPGAGLAVFWAGCCRSCSISMHAPPTSAPPPTVTPPRYLYIYTGARYLGIYTGTRYLGIYTGTTYLH